MKGFWTNQTVEQKVAAGVYSNTADNRHPCDICGLYKECVNPYMPMGGEGQLGVLAIGEGPGFEEDQRNTQFVGKAGQLLEKHFGKHGIDIHRDFYFTNAVNCRPPKNRTPKPKEITCCRGIVRGHIEEANPWLILLLGESAIKSFLGDRFSDDTSVARWQGLCIPDPTTGAWVVPMYHPSFALRSGTDRNKVSMFERNVAYAVQCIGKHNQHRPVFTDFESMVEISTNYESITDALDSMFEVCQRKEYLYMVYDYESTAKKPYGLGHDLLSCSISVADDWCFSFPIAYPGIFSPTQIHEIKERLAVLMINPYALKIAHNAPFEDLWSRVALNVPRVEGWEWCTMNAAHALDSRRRFCGLKFQAYINFGMYSYEKKAKALMVARQPGTKLNRLHELPIHDLLKYGGLDTILTRHLFNLQRPILTNFDNDPRANAFMFFMEGIQNLADATYTGIPTDQLYYLETVGQIQHQLEKIENKLLQGKTAGLFKLHTGKPLTLVEKDFSSVDLRMLLFEILNLKATKTTPSGLKSVDKEVLADFTHPWVKLLLERRRLSKLLGTYVLGLVNEIDPDTSLVHPFWPLHTARTYRGSSTDPNLQNQPIRDEESKKTVRDGVRADEGWHLGAVDYGSMEVRIAACCSQDPKLVWYCKQTGSDLHQDVAERIWQLPGNEVTGAVRFHSKGGFVFAEIYGSYYVNCAVTMWEECLLKEKTKGGIPLRQHLKDVGIIDGANSAKTKYRIRGHLQTVPRHQAQFIEHVKGVEKWFWEEFGMLREWQERLVAEYQANGYVEMFFGFRRGGLLTNNKIFNTAIQGTAFHCLLWCFNHMTGWCNAWMEGRTIGEIHDEIMYHMPSGEVQAIMDESEWVMCTHIREQFDWIIVPLAAEPELSPPGGSWANMHEMIRGIDNKWVLKNQAP